jgi:hypothetical protein
VQDARETVPKSDQPADGSHNVPADIESEACGRLKVDLDGNGSTPGLSESQQHFSDMAPPLQGQLAKRIGRSQQWISDVEQGQHRVSVVEFLEFAEAPGFDPRSAIGRIARVKG